MSRFDRVARLAYQCFRNKADYWGWIKVDKKENYIGVVTCKCGDTVTEVLYEPKEKSARILTFDKNHYEESRFSELLKYLGIDSKIEVCNTTAEESSFGTFCTSILPHSPSGRVEDELMKDYFECFGVKPLEVKKES